MNGNSTTPEYPIHFLIGTGRCGSTLLHEMLCRHRDVAFMSNIDDRFGTVPAVNARSGRIYRSLPHRFTEKGTMRFAPSEGYRAMSREIGPIMAMSSRDLVHADATPWLTDRVNRFFTQRLAAQPETFMLHKFTGWPRAGFLQAVFPDARFVHVVRDGRAVANSWLQMPWWMGYSGPQNWHWGEIPGQYHDAWESSGRSFVTLAGIAWMILIDAWETARATLPAGSWLDVRYEDIVARPAQTSEVVLDFLGIPPDDQFAAQLGRYTFDVSRGDAYVRELGEDDVARLDDVMGEHLTRYGYHVHGDSGGRT